MAPWTHGRRTGRVYTVREIRHGNYFVTPKKRIKAIGIYVEEVDAPNNGAFNPIRFRPVQRSTERGMETPRALLKEEKRELKPV